MLWPFSRSLARSKVKRDSYKAVEDASNELVRADEALCEAKRREVLAFNAYESAWKEEQGIAGLYPIRPKEIFGKEVI